MQRDQEVEIGSPRCRVAMISISQPVLAGYRGDPAFTGGRQFQLQRGQCHALIADDAVHWLMVVQRDMIRTGCDCQDR
jgi:hypothetical protein